MGLRVVGLSETLEAAKNGEANLEREVLKEIRRALVPMRNQIRNEFQALGGTGPQVAKSVRSSVTGKSVAVQFGGPQHPYAAGREFGAKRRSTRPFIVSTGRYATRGTARGSRAVVVRRIPYASPTIFGPWTGNQFELGETGGRLTLGEVAGNAFYPTVGAGAQNVYDELGRLADRFLARFPGAATSTGAAQARRSPVGQLASFLASGGL